MIDCNFRMRCLRQLRLWIAAALCAAVHQPATAQTGANVLLVVNDATAAGTAVAAEYQKRRAVPEANVCHVMAGTEETIARPAYLASIEQPVWRCISRAAAQDRILYIVLTKGMPIRIAGTSGRMGTVASVDSELTLLYRRRIDQASVPLAGSVPNPYFAGAAPIADLQPFTHERTDIYLVTRLDGYTVEDAIGVVRRGAEPTRDGRFVLDERASWNQQGNNWLLRAADRLRDAGFTDRIVFDDTNKVVVGQSNVLGYYSWGTNDPAIRVRHFQIGFAPGAIAGMFVSTDGRTFNEPPTDWKPGDWSDRAAHFAGSPQSLMGDLIRDGVTGIAGHVEEPYLDATIRPDILFPAYVHGMNLAEAFYAAMPFLSWQTIVVGDPLCAPFRQRPIPDSALGAAVDPSTEMPARFSARRLAAMPKQVNADAQRAYARFESRLDRGDLAGAREALGAAIGHDARFTMARFALASLAEQGEQYDEAIEQYRTIIAYAPNDPVALNNLAYALAVRKNAAAEALPIAQRANTVARDNATIADTLAWVLHLVGRDKDALPSIVKARTELATNPDVRWHYAVILAELKDTARARQELDAFLKLAPSAADRADVKRLLQTLNGSK